jgi:hypothetical protein
MTMLARSFTARSLIRRERGRVSQSPATAKIRNGDVSSITSLKLSSSPLGKWWDGPEVRLCFTPSRGRRPPPQVSPQGETARRHYWCRSPLYVRESELSVVLRAVLQFGRDAALVFGLVAYLSEIPVFDSTTTDYFLPIKSFEIGTRG